MSRAGKTPVIGKAGVGDYEGQEIRWKRDAAGGSLKRISGGFAE